MMKNIGIVAGVIVVLFIVLFAVWFNSLTQMKPVAAYEVNPTAIDQTLLIATQGSEYKDALTGEVVNAFKGTETYIKVIDVADLKDIKREDWQAILMIQAWQKWEPNEAVEAFIGDSFDPNTMFLVTTADDGESQMEGIDGITGESSLEKVDGDLKRILSWLDVVYSKAGN